MNTAISAITVLPAGAIEFRVCEQCGRQYAWSRSSGTACDKVCVSCLFPPEVFIDDDE